LFHVVEKGSIGPNHVRMVGYEEKKEWKTE
jgi:hypothetical protein